MAVHTFTQYSGGRGRGRGNLCEFKTCLVNIVEKKVRLHSKYRVGVPHTQTSTHLKRQ